MDLRNIQPVTALHVSKKIANKGFCFLLSQILVLTFTRTEVTTIRMKLCFILLMDQTAVYILLWFFQRDQCDPSSSMHTVIQSQKFSISIPTYKLEMYHMCSIEHCTLGATNARGVGRERRGNLRGGCMSKLCVQ
jgi:hypothetical protein